MSKGKRTGTKEWSEYSKNTHIGCKNNCRYCYARKNAERYGHVEDGEWEHMKRNKYSQNENFKKLDGRIMYPTTHDIFPETVNVAIDYITGWLEEGNDMLIVSKPNPYVISHLCNSLMDYQDQIVFRFTIGSMDELSIEFWERNSPPFYERISALKKAYRKGYETSVSCEPYLDETIIDLLDRLVEQDYVTDSIWVGKMNKIESRVDTEGWNEEQMLRLKRVKAVQTDEFVEYLYARFSDREKIHWKDSIKEVIGLEPEPIG